MKAHEINAVLKKENQKNKQQKNPQTTWTAIHCYCSLEIKMSENKDSSGDLFGRRIPIIIQQLGKKIFLPLVLSDYTPPSLSVFT